MAVKKSYEFEQDFDRMVIIPVHLGRLFFENGESIRLYFTPTGMKALIRKNKENSNILIEEDFGETELVGLGAK